MRTFRRHAAAVGIALLIASGCSHHPSGVTTATTAIAANTTSSTAPASSTTVTSSPISSPTTTPATTVGSCHSAGLSASLTSLGGAAGTQYSALVFKNETGTACTLRGYPGVSFVNASGAQIGSPVPRDSGAIATITLAPGATAAAQLAYHDAYVSTVADCQQTAASGIRVYPPNETAPLIVATTMMACVNSATTGTAGISPVTTTASLNH